MTATTKICSLFVIITLSFLQVEARAQNLMDSKEIDASYQDTFPFEQRKLYGSPNDIPNMYDDDFLSRLQFQLLNSYAKSLQSPSRSIGLPQNSIQHGSNDIDGSKSINEQKRHPRYRQCYFNPISCFKK